TVAKRQLDAQLAARVALVETRDLAPADGCRDVKALLKAFARQAPQHTRDQLQTGRMLAVMPQLAAAAAQGRVPPEHLRLVQDLVKRIGAGKAALLDEYLTATVSTSTAKQTADACAEILAHLDPDGPAPDPNADFEQRYLSLTHRGNHVHLRGQLDLEA